MILRNWHVWTDHLTLRFFHEDQQWLHILVHIVLVIMPALMLCILLWAFYSVLRSYSAYRLLPNTNHHVSSSFHSIPRYLIQFIKRYTYRNQILLALGALLTLPITYTSLELPKRIINGAINADNFASSRIAVSLTQVDYLLVLCGLYLLVLVLNGTLKFCLNYYKGSVAERLIKRLRLYIFHNQRKSSKTFSKDNLIPVIIQEVEPVCGFSGDSFTVPLLHGGTALTIITFMLVQDVALGAAAITLLPIQMLIIPRFQKKINRLVRQRVLSTRQLSKHINSSKDCINAESHKHVRLHFTHLHDLRLNIFKTKYMMKSLNNFIMNLTPFFFYTIGGYLVIEGDLSLGALVASLASFKDLSASIRELFTYYQSLQDAKIRYREIFTYLQKV